MGILNFCRTTAAVTVLAVATFGVSATSMAAEAVLRLSHTTPERMDQGSQAWAAIFKEEVESKTDGAIEVRIMGANAAGSEREQIQKVQAGINQMTINSEIVMPSFFEPAQIFGIPYLFSSNAVAWEVLDGTFGQNFNDAWREATGLRIVGIFNAGFRSFFNNEKEIRSPADLKGLKIRTGENQAHIEMVRALGGNPTPIAWAEVYTSLQQGVVDGMENPPGLAYAMKFHEHQQFLTLDRHLFSIHAAMISEASFQSLSPAQQAIVIEAARTATTVARATVLLDERKALEDLREAGLQIYTPSSEEYEQFRDLGRPLVEENMRQAIGDEWVDELLTNINIAEEAVSQP